MDPYLVGLDLELLDVGQQVDDVARAARRDLEHLHRAQLDHPVADQHAAAAAQGDHDVDVLVLLQARVAARLDLEVALLEARGHAAADGSHSL